MTNIEENKISGIILCGGQSKRMKQNKALLKLGKLSIIEHVILQLLPVCTEILISSNNNELEMLPFKKVPDKIKNAGPIAGFYSGLSESKFFDNLIVSCDTPFISTALLKYLLLFKKEFDIVLPVFENQIQPMVGYFNKNNISSIEKEISLGNTKPINIFENSNSKLVNITNDLPFFNENLFFNVNNENDYLQAQRIYSAISTSKKK